MSRPSSLPEVLWKPLLEASLREDLGRAGDLTTAALVDENLRASGRVVARREGRIAGLEIATATFRLLEPSATIEILRGDGEDAAAGESLAVVEGKAGSLLTAERTALNLLGRLCGIATTTRDLVEKVAHTDARIACTRKTTPGLRALEKYAVRCGGGANHRFGLDDAVLIKDNHLVLAGGVRAAIEKARSKVGHLVKIELEVDTLEQLREALEVGVDAVLLDNMNPETLREAVGMVAGRAVTEASGGITPVTAAAIAESGVDLLSVGWITHSAPSLDVAFDIGL